MDFLNDTNIPPDSELTPLIAKVAALVSRADVPADIQTDLATIKEELEAYQEHHQDSSAWRQNRFEGLVRSLHVGIIVFDSTGNVTYSNPMADFLFGLTHDETLSRTAFQPDLRFFREDGSPANIEDLPVTHSLATGQSLRNITVGIQRERDGELAWLLVSTEPNMASDGTLKRLICTVSDITEQKRAEQALRESQRFIERIANALPNVMYIFDLVENRNVYTSAEITKLLGYSSHEIQAMESRLFPTIVHPDDMALLPELGKRFEAASDADVMEHDLRLLRSDGQAIWAHFREVVFSRTPDGKARQILGTFHDVTERKRADHLIRENEAKFRAMTETVDAAIIILRGTRLLYANSTTELLSGYSLDELKSINMLDVVHPAFREYVSHEIYGKSLDRRVPERHEISIVKKSGEIRWHYISVLGIEYEGRPAALTTSIDITERKESEDALRRNEQQYRTLFAAAQRQTQELALLDRARTVLFRDLDFPLVVRNVVEAVVEIFGYSHVSVYRIEGDELVLYHQHGYNTVISKISLNDGVAGRVARTGDPILLEDITTDPNYLAAIPNLTSEICIPLFERDRVVGIFSVESVAPMRLTQADFRLIVSLGEHISMALERGRLYTEVRESETKNRALLNALPDLIMRFDRNGQHIEVKRSLYFNTLVSPEDLIGKNIADFLPPELASDAYRRTNEVLNTGIMQLYEYHLWQEGQMRDFEARMVPSGDDEVLVVIRDITQLKIAQRQQLEIEQVRLLKTFIGNTSHDLHTPITNLLTSAYLLEKQTQRLLQDKIRLADELGVEISPKAKSLLNDIDAAVVKIDERADSIEKNSIRLQKLVETMTDMVRLDSDIAYAFGDFDLNTLVSQSIEVFTTNATRKGITIKRESPNEPLSIYVDEEEFSRAIDNLIENAIDYTPNGGTIYTRTYKRDESVILEIRDTGIGISDEDLPFIFDRFFRASKARSTEYGGTGLGLPIAKKIIEAHQGRIEVESTIGKGSTFRVIMPA